MSSSSCGVSAWLAPSEAETPHAARNFLGYSGDDPRGLHHGMQLTRLEEFAGSVAHDFRNILAIIRSALHLAERQADDRGKLTEFLSAAHSCVDQGMTLTSDLLAFVHEQKEPVGPKDLNALLADFETVLGLAAGPGISIVTHPGPGVPPCTIDRRGFRSALLNLVLNARDAMPSGGEIHISTNLVNESGGDWTDGRGAVRVRIRDQGSGMPESVVHRVFEPFFTTKAANGTGLGLPQVCAFAERAGGGVILESGPGKGTTVDLLLPVHDADPQSGFWRQLDRWINEGGAPAADFRRHNSEVEFDDAIGEA